MVRVQLEWRTGAVQVKRTEWEKARRTNRDELKEAACDEFDKQKAVSAQRVFLTNLYFQHFGNPRKAAAAGVGWKGETAHRKQNSTQQLHFRHEVTSDWTRTMAKGKGGKGRLKRNCRMKELGDRLKKMGVDEERSQRCFQGCRSQRRE